MFAEICRDYFPRWRNAQHWELRQGSRGQWIGAQGERLYTTEQGYCDPANRIIWLSDTSTVTLIHEICHAVTSASHDKRFRTRLRKAAQHAERLGETTLAGALYKEADAYEDETAFTPTAAYVYDKVEEVVRGVPEIAFDAVVDFLAGDLSLTAPELCQQYRKLRRVYERAQKEWAR
jgi:hypothetical protein